MRPRHWYLLLISLVVFFLYLSSCREIENPHPSDLHRTGFLFNYRIINNTPPPLRTVAQTINRFDKGKLAVLVPSRLRMPEGIAGAYFRRSGVRVEFTYYEFVADAKKRLDSAEIQDLAIVPDFFAKELNQGEFIDRIRPENVPNLRNIAPQFSKPAFDPEGQHVVPLLWRSAGIVYNTRRLDFRPRTWNDLFSPELKAYPMLKGRLGLTASPHAIWSATQLLLGQSPQTENPEGNAQVLATLRDLGAQGRFELVEEDEIADQLATENILLAFAYSSDATNAARRNASIAFALPLDGSWVSYDTAVVLVKTNYIQRRIAEDFINFLLEPTVSAELANSSLQACTVEGARPYLLPEIRLGPSSLTPLDGWQSVAIHRDESQEAEIFTLFTVSRKAEPALPPKPSK